MSELAEVVEPCRDEIKKRGGKSLKVQPIQGSGIEKGTPDIIACYRSVMLVVECKLKGELPTKIQCHRLRQWRCAGAVAIVADCRADVTRAMNFIDVLLSKFELTGNIVESVISI